jgi:transcriptional regulator with XRE-family HTH domain
VAMPDDTSPAPRSLADKIDRLFAVVRPTRGEYTHEQVAKAIEERGGPTISASYLWQLRRGLRDNPTKKHLEALAGFFGVPPSYFFDQEESERIDAELDLLAALRDASVRQVALRASGLSAQTLRAITEMIDRARQIEGLDDRTGNSRAEDAGTSRGS